MRSPIISVQNAALGPLITGGKAKFAFERSTVLFGKMGHLRSRSKGVIVDADSDRELLTEPTARLPSAIYGGVLFPHFGHFLAESIHRIWPIFFKRYSQLPIAFHPPFGIDGLPEYMTSTFAYLGIEKNIRLIREPTTFDTLYIPPQRSLFGAGATDKAYTHFLATRAVGRRPARRRSKHLYIGRLEHLHTGSIIGEPMLAKVLSENDEFDVITPEVEDIADLVHWYEQAETLIFIEGSAIHLLELCGPIKATVLVICKGPALAAREVHFGKMLESKSRKVEYFENAERLVPISAFPGDVEPYWAKASAYPDFDNLFATVERVSGVPINRPSYSEIKSACLASLGQLVLDRRITPQRMTDEQVGRLVRRLREQVARLKLI